MNNNATRLLVLAAFVGLVTLLGIIALPKDKRDPVVKHTYIEQEQTERTWVEQNFEQVALRYPIYEALYNPLLMKVQNEHLYIVDYGDTRLKRFSLDGRLLNTIGLGRGQGPGEVGNITDFYVRGGNVWIADPATRSVSAFTTDGTYLSRFITKGPMPRITGLQNNLVLMAMMSPELFHQVDTAGTTVKTFGDLVKDQTQQFMMLDGFFVADEEGGFLFVPSSASYIYHYGESGTLKKVVQTIDRIPFPDVASAETGSGIAFFAPDPDILINNASIQEGTLYLHAKFVQEQTEGGHLSVLDRYDVHTGSYVSSTRLPFAARNAIVYGDRLYCLHDTTVSILQLDP